MCTSENKCWVTLSTNITTVRLISHLKISDPS